MVLLLNVMIFLNIFNGIKNHFFEKISKDYIQIIDNSLVLRQINILEKVVDKISMGVFFDKFWKKCSFMTQRTFNKVYKLLFRIKLPKSYPEIFSIETFYRMSGRFPI